MNALPVLSLFAFIMMLVLLPLVFGELMATSLEKLHLSPEMALLLMIAIIIGGFANIPVKRIQHERVVPMHPLAVVGLGRLWPQMARKRRETIIAVNLSGCIVPTGLAVYQLLYLSAAGTMAVFARDHHGRDQYRGVLFCCPSRARCWDLTARIGARGGSGTAGAGVCARGCSACRLCRGCRRAARR